MDDLDLDLRRLRPEPAPEPATVAAHRHQLDDAIAAAPARPVRAPRTSAGLPPTGMDDDTDAGGDVAVPLAPRRPERARRLSAGGWGRAAAAAAAILVAAVGAIELASGPAGQVDVDTVPSASPTSGSMRAAATCGGALPFEFRAPAGFVGPRPGPSGPAEGAGAGGSAPPESVTHWSSARGATIDVRWPAWPPLDPTTPYEERVTQVTGPLESAVPGGGTALHVSLSNRSFGPGECAVVDIIVAGDRAAAGLALDQVLTALVGPGAPLAIPEDRLIARSTTADELPDVEPCHVAGAPATGLFDDEDATTYPAARSAFQAFVATRPSLYHGGYEQVTVPDGSVGFVQRKRAHGPATIVVHAVQGPRGWAVPDARYSAC